VIVLAKGSGWRLLIKEKNSVEHTTSEFSTRRKKGLVELHLVFRTPGSSATYKPMLNKYEKRMVLFRVWKDED
jgi:hypothetical protein